MIKSIGKYTVSGRLTKEEFERFEQLMLKKKMQCKNASEEAYCIKANIVREAVIKYMDEVEKPSPQKDQTLEEIVRGLFNRIERKTINQT